LSAAIARFHSAAGLAQPIVLPDEDDRETLWPGFSVTPYYQAPKSSFPVQIFNSNNSQKISGYQRKSAANFLLLFHRGAPCFFRRKAS
jgi:hypothetical protein